MRAQGFLGVVAQRYTRRHACTAADIVQVRDNIRILPVVAFNKRFHITQQDLCVADDMKSSVPDFACLSLASKVFTHPETSGSRFLLTDPVRFNGLGSKGFKM